MKKDCSVNAKGISNPHILGLIFVGLSLGTVLVSGQSGKQASARTTPEWTVGQPQTGERGIRKSTAQLNTESAAVGPRKHFVTKHELKVPWREHRPQDPNALPVASYPPSNSAVTSKKSADAPQPVALSFDTATGPDETGAFPPDTMGAVGPTQFILAVNGLLRSFTKAGVADGVLNANTDVFFAPVMTPIGGNVGVNFTTDPQIRFDRLSGKWFITMGDVPLSADQSVSYPNRLMIAVSDSSTITAGTVWTFYYFQQNTLGGGDSNEFADYPSLGIDNNALYIGCDMFDATTSAYTGTSAFVVRKSSVLTGGPIVATPFRQIAGAATQGPFAPRGVDNYNPTATEGYFVGVSNTNFNQIVFRRIATPGGTPTIGINIVLTVPTTSFAILVDHLGNTAGTNGRLDGLDDNLFAAHIRGTRLWTAHGIAVTSAGVASTSNVQRRNAARWYEFNVPVGAGNPTIVQSGTVFNNAATVAAARQYWIPTAMVSGQGHAAFGYSTAGTPFAIDAATNGRLVGDTLGTSGAVSLYSGTAGAYNPSGDTGGTGGRRWGDYSFTCLDPLDDMTFWTIQEYCNGANTYGCRVAKLLAPPPATPASASPNSIAAGQASVSVTITGTAVAGSGFYDPGANLSSPAVPFNHIGAGVTGGVTVNSVTYLSPTSVTLDLNTTGATGGTKDVTITNPDGQFLTGTGILTVTSPLTISSAVSRKTHGGAGTFDIALPLTGEPGLESRSTAGNHTIVVTFSNNVVSGTAAVIAGTGTVSGSPAFSGNTMTVSLTGVTSAQQITVRLSGVTDTLSQMLPDTDINMNVLVGDVNVSKSITATDILQTKSSIGTAVDGTNFRKDVNANGEINATDVTLVKQNLGTGFPP